jgi:uncharacterized protein YndB with AHSA1/START domain
VADNFEARKSIRIAASVERVWQTLTDPDLVREYMHGTSLETDWNVGSPVAWSGEWKGQSYRDKGTVLAVERGSLLSYTHWSPLGGSEDRPENYHTVTFQLQPSGAGTTLDLIQDNNPTQEAAEQMADNNWGPMLDALKKVAEGSP